MFDTTKIATIGKTLLVAALAGTALTAISQDAFARGGGFRGGGGGGFHFGGGGGGFHFGGGRPSFGGGRHFAAPRSFGGARVSHSFRPRASFARPHVALAHQGFARPFGGTRTTIGGRFAGRPAVGPHFGTGKPNGPLATNGRPAVGPHFGTGAKPIGPLAMNHGFKPGHHPGFPGGKGHGPRVRLPGRLLVLGVGLAGIGLAAGDDAPGYDYPGYAPVYSGPAPLYVPVAGGPTIPRGPLLPAKLVQAPVPAPVAPVPAAAPEQPAGSFVNVVFQAAVTPQDVETFMKAYNVTIVDGPAPDGTVRVQLSTEPMADKDLAAVVESMKSQTAFVKDVKPV